MKTDEPWSVYIVECADKSLYTGIAKDVAKRVATHNSGKGAKYTSHRLPVVLRYKHTFESRTLAAMEEVRIKKLARDQKLKLISGVWAR